MRENYYDAGYYKGANTYSYVDEREDRVIRDVENKRRVLNIKKFLSGVTEPTLLDVGCSFGALMRVAEENGFHVSGLDMSTYAHKFHYKDCFIGDVCDGIPDRHGKFDVITMIETVEHLHNPRRALAHCHDAMNENGLLVLQTTNMDSIVRRWEGSRSGYFLPGHTFYFSANTLTKMLERSRFKVEKIYYGHETGMVTAIIRKMLTNLERHKFSDWRCFLYTVMCHLLSKIHIGKLAVHNGMVVYARRV